MLNLHVYYMFHLAAGIPINASLSKAEMVLLIFTVLEKSEKNLFVHKSQESITYLLQSREIKYVAINSLQSWWLNRDCFWLL